MLYDTDPSSLPLVPMPADAAVVVAKIQRSSEQTERKV